MKQSIHNGEGGGSVGEGGGGKGGFGGEGSAGGAPHLNAPPALTEWVSEQLSMPPSLHRAYWRERANPRLESPIAVGRPRPNTRDWSIQC